MSYISALEKDDKVYIWERTDTGDRIMCDHPGKYYFYYDDPEGKYRTIFNTPVSKLEFDSRAQLRKAKQSLENKGLQTWESDVPVEIRMLSNMYYGMQAPKLNVTFYDIEVDYDPNIGFSSIQNPYAPINSVAICHAWKKQLVILVVPPEPGWDEARLRKAVNEADPDAPVPEMWDVSYVICKDERELLLNMLLEFDDSDILCGWNSDFFDMPYVGARMARVLDNHQFDLSVKEEINEETGKIKLVFNKDPNKEIQAKRLSFFKQLDFAPIAVPNWRPVAAATGKLMGVTLDLRGRVRLDYMALVKKYEPGEKPSYKLAAISDAVLVDDKTKEPLLPKLEYEGSLADLYRDNFPFFVRYNIRDTEILYGFEQKLGYVELANQMAHLSTGQFTDVLGTLKLAEYALINYCHYELKKVVKNITKPEIDRAIDGALVLYPQVGLHENAGSIDINSLYPSAIRSLNISPEMIRGQFVGESKDALEIAKNSDKELTLVLEQDNKEYTKTAAEWRDLFIQKKWAVSGYGTVFDQSSQGFIPALLADWYDQRKKYQKLKKEAGDAGDYEKANYYDRLQYVYKIKLNSLYGALTNLYFRFYDLRMGESTTGTGRMILRHQCRYVSYLLEDKYDVDFPMYETIQDAMKSGYGLHEAVKISLNSGVVDGRLYTTPFDGKHHSDVVIYGDTDSTYFKTYAGSVEEATVIADAIADKVNRSYPEFMRNTFLCTPGFDDIIKCGREIISDRGIFVEKKRYILHLVDLDGKKVDKMKVMGLDTKKTTLPARVSAKLNGFIERFLKGEPWESVSKTIVEYKDELRHSKDVTDIGLPKGVKGLEDYQYKFDVQGNDARLPGHVAASIHYNQQLKNYNDKVSMPIMSGMKIKVFYLIGDYGKFKSIALPVDIEVIPKWFLEEFRVDKNAHIERLVDNPLSNILKAIGKQPPTKDSLFLANFLEF